MSSSSLFQSIVDAIQPPRATGFERLYIDRRSILVIASSLPARDLKKIATALKISAKDIDWISVSDEEALISAGTILKVVVKGQPNQTLDFTKTPISHIKRFTHRGEPAIALWTATKPDLEKHESIRLDFAGSGSTAVRNRVFRLLEPNHRLSIGVFGATGVGKSTLINSILGVDSARTATGGIGTKGVHLYATPDGKYAFHDIEGWDATEGTTGIERILGILDDLESAGRGCAIDSLWYCINSGSNRKVEVEEELIKRVERMGIPVQLVVTRSSAKHDTEFETKLMKDPLTTLLRPNFVRAKEEYRSAPHGIDELLASTRELVARVRF